MTEIEKASRVETLDGNIFLRMRGQDQILAGPEFEKILEEVPGFSFSEVGELKSRLKKESLLSSHEANESLAMMSTQARSREDGRTIKSLRNYFLAHFNLVDAGLVYWEGRKRGE